MNNAAVTGETGEILPSAKHNGAKGYLPGGNTTTFHALSELSI